MKSFNEIEKQYLDEHHDDYRGFTRLLITLSVAFITLLIATMENLTSDSAFYVKISVTFQLASLFFGLVVQHQLMMRPLKQLKKAAILNQKALKFEDDTQIEMLDQPSMIERISYMLQISSFLISFSLIAFYIVFKAGNLI
ncbi:hypothetical protein [uncultured Methylophaga sp.]|uniref:hypothetical protein n=1 Tax=uncultured Methylophaga sp. TaxID=285271 RepID=UPI0026082324|nr:hypothetical protein [uncultured Methylophaga sp.]|tara:strand:+ start:456 stop:878 length:423 start_codon:yes stop_codon:yes gene_type:complete